jgi:hypothetical protein
MMLVVASMELHIIPSMSLTSSSITHHHHAPYYYQPLCRGPHGHSNRHNKLTARERLRFFPPHLLAQPGISAPLGSIVPPPFTSNPLDHTDWLHQPNAPGPTHHQHATATGAAGDGVTMPDAIASLGAAWETMKEQVLTELRQQRRLQLYAERSSLQPLPIANRNTSSLHFTSLD